MGNRFSNLKSIVQEREREREKANGRMSDMCIYIFVCVCVWYLPVWVLVFFLHQHIRKIYYYSDYEHIDKDLEVEQCQGNSPLDLMDLHAYHRRAQHPFKERDTERGEEGGGEVRIIYEDELYIIIIKIR